MTATNPIISDTFAIKLEDGESLRGDIRLYSNANMLPAIIFCHGFKGFKDFGPFPYMAETLASRGFAVITFNFSLNGVGESLTEFTELEKFKRNTLAREARELETIIEALGSQTLPLSKHINIASIGLMGHSRGGFAVLANANHKRIKAVCTLASIANMPDIPEITQKSWRQSGVHYIENPRTKQMMPLDICVLSDWMTHQNSIETFTRKLSKPLLIIHGDTDSSVSIENAFRLKTWVTNSELCIIAGATHGFCTKHPFDGSSPEFDQAINAATLFFKKHLIDHRNCRII